MPFVQIGSDGGYLRAPVDLTSFTFGPGERGDFLVNFTNPTNGQPLPAGTKVNMTNSAPAPFPDGDAVDPATTAQVMQFTMTGNPGFAPLLPGGILNPSLADFPNLPNPSNTRYLTLVEIQGPNGPTAVMLDGQSWDAPVSEKPKLGATEDWVIINLTNDTHPIHTHLTQFQLMSRQALTSSTEYFNAWVEQNNGLQPPFPTTHTTVSLNPAPLYLTGAPEQAPPNEQGWKDTVRMNPGEVIVFRVRFAPIGGGSYPFDATKGPGYVWHCHIIDHEDNEMMRPYIVVS